MKRYFALIALLALAPAATAQNLPAAKQSPANNFIPNPGAMSIVNPFGGTNYYAPGGPFVFTVPNQFGGEIYSTGGFSVPNRLGGMNYYTPGGGMSFTIRNPFGGYTYVTPTVPAPGPGGPKVAGGIGNSLPFANYHLSNGAFTTPSLFGGSDANYLGNRVSASKGDPLADYNLNRFSANSLGRVPSATLTPFGASSSLLR